MYFVDLFEVLLVLFVLPVLAVWPAPQSITTGSASLWVEPTIKVTYNGRSVWNNHHSSVSGQNNEQVLDSQTSPDETDAAGTISSQAIVQRAVARSLDALFKKSPVPWKQHPRHELSKFEPHPGPKKAFVSSLSITQKNLQHTLKPLAGEVDESYNLTIAQDGKATINAVSSFGVIHGLETFVQLFYQHSVSGRGPYTPFAPVSIVDSPKFKHRGLNLVCNHTLPNPRNSCCLLYH